MQNESLKLKLLDAFYDTVTTKRSKLPIYHGNDMKSFVPADTDKNLRVCAPLAANMNLPALHAWIDKLSADDRIGLAGIAVSKDGRLVAEHYNAPYGKGYRHVSFSMCKSVIGMAIGICEQEHLLSLSERLADIFPEYIGLFTKKGMKEVTIRHLLTMTSGVRFDEVSSYFSEDWRKSFLASDVSFTPGTDFTYNSLNSYMLAAIVTKRAGCSVTAYLKPRLFYPLGITDVTWDRCPKGIEQGGWGMKLSLQDMLKLGQLYLDDGVILRNGKRIRLLSSRFIREATRVHVNFTDGKVTKGYGYQLWCLKDGAVLFNGVFGQNVYINRRRRLVIACTAGGCEIFPDGRLVSEICRFSADDARFRRKPVQTARALVRKYCKDLTNRKSQKESNARYESAFRDSLRPYQKKIYKLNGIAPSILPAADQLFYSDYRTGMERLALELREHELLLHVRDGKERFHIRMGYRPEAPYQYQVVTIGGKEMPVAAHCEWIETAENQEPADAGAAPDLHLVILLYYLEETVSKRLDLEFYDNRIRISGADMPDMTAFLGKLAGEPLMERTKKLGKIKNNTFIKEKAEKILFPVCEGTER